MSLELSQGSEAPRNPLDILEEIVAANEWPFDRADDCDMVVEISGQWCGYRLFFLWRDDISALHVSCAYDLRVPAGKRREVNDLLALVNDAMWLGHFSICSQERVPLFRHTLPLRGMASASVEQLEDLMDIAVTESDRLFPAFQLVLWGGRSPADALAAAILEPVGEA